MEELSVNARAILNYLDRHTEPTSRLPAVTREALGLDERELQDALEELAHQKLIRQHASGWHNLTTAGRAWVKQAQKSGDIFVSGDVGPGAVVGSGSVRADTIAGGDIETGDQSPSSDPVSREDAKVLIIEDVPSQRFSIKQVLDELELKCIVAGDFDSALMLIRSEKFDLITLDMQLDPMDLAGQAGLSLLDQIKSYQRETPVIIISGLSWTGPQVRDFLREYGVFDYFTKPFQPDKLRLCVDKALES